MNVQKLFISLIILFGILINFFQQSYAKVEPREAWWLEEPYRLVQTNLREIDAIDFDIDIYVESLKNLGANVVLINVGGIVANYYTDLDFHFRNPNLKFDLIAKVIPRLHDEGIRVMGRFDFSKVNEVIAAEHPEWLYKAVKGHIVNYNGQVHTCINGGYQQEASLEILKEALTRFKLDGVFFNMIGYTTRDYSHNEHGICQCENCKNRFAEWSGGMTLPIIKDGDDPVFRQYQKFQNETKAEQFYKVKEVIKSFGNQIAICTYTHAGTDFFRREANSHGQLYNESIASEYNAAHNVKITRSSWKDKQVSNAAVHFIGYPTRHSADNQWVTQRRLVQNIMYGGGLDFYCIGRIDNLEDRKVLKNVKQVFQFHKANEQFLHHTISGNKVLMLHDGTGQSEYLGLYQMLTENHILFDVMEAWNMNGDDVAVRIEDYEVVVVPNVVKMSGESCTRIDEYVKSGGTLLVTGFSSTCDEIGNPLEQIRLNSLGVKPEFKKYDKVMGNYYRICEKDKARLKDSVFNDLDIVYAWEEGMICEMNDGAEGLLGFIPPAMIGPPEKCYYTEVTENPGIIYNEFGMGKTVFFPFKIGSIYNHTAQYGHELLVVSALKNLLGYQSEIETRESPLVEISRQRSKEWDFEVYGLLNHAGQLGKGHHAPLAITDVEFKFKPIGKVKSITNLRNKKDIEFEVTDEKIGVKVPVLNDFEFLLVAY